MFNNCNWKDPEDAVLYKQMLDKDRIYDFLAGLNKELDEVRGRLLGMRPLLSIKEIFAGVCREESRKCVMLGEGPTQVIENSALVVCGPEAHGSKKGQLWSNHCQRPHHTKETCWKVHGKPTNWVPNRFRGKDAKGL